MIHGISPFWKNDPERAGRAYAAGSAPRKARTFLRLGPPHKVSLYKIAHAVQSTRFAAGDDLGSFGAFTALGNRMKFGFAIAG
jgi:hypothetical protein